MSHLSRARVALLVALVLTFAPAGISPREASRADSSVPVLDGFTAEESAAQRRLEEQFRAIPTPAAARAKTEGKSKKVKGKSGVGSNQRSAVSN